MSAHFAARRARRQPWRTAFERLFLAAWAATGHYQGSLHRAHLLAGVARACAGRQA